MGQLRDRMEQDLILKGFQPATRRNYLLYGRRLAAFHRRSSEELGEADIRGFLMHLLQVDHLSYSTWAAAHQPNEASAAARSGKNGTTAVKPANSNTSWTEPAKPQKTILPPTAATRFAVTTRTRRPMLLMNSTCAKSSTSRIGLSPIVASSLCLNCSDVDASRPDRA